jgi:precorrin-3B C17-methyltransferase
MKKGEIYIVSTGVGEKEHMTFNALTMLQKADIIVGYKKYIEDIKPLIEGKLSYSSGMTQEVDRCKYAIEKALEKNKVALISNGDVNVYGMAGLVLEIIDANKLWDKLEIVIEPGITTFLAAAAKVGAPVMNDFAVISLSNLLTPVELIQKRLKNALEADFVLGIYNPLSKTRKEPYIMFLELLQKTINSQIPVTIAQNLGREDEKIIICTVAKLINAGDDMEMVNMSSVLIIGNSTSRIVNNGKSIITRRGYQQVYEYSLDKRE